MKRLFTILLTLVACVCCIMALSACSTDENTSNPLIGKWEKTNLEHDVNYYSIEFLDNGVCVVYLDAEEVWLVNPDDYMDYETESVEYVYKYKYKTLDGNRVALLDYETDQLNREPEEFEVIGNTLILDGEEYIKVR